MKHIITGLKSKKMNVKDLRLIFVEMQTWRRNTIFRIFIFAGNYRITKRTSLGRGESKIFKRGVNFMSKNKM